MDVLIDDQMFVTQKRGGITRYFTQLMRQFDATSAVDLTMPYRYVANEHLVEAFPGKFRLVPRPYHAPVHPVLDCLNARYRRSAGRVDLIHHTYYRANHLQEYDGRARVCTIYDMIPEHFPEMFPRGNPHRDKKQFTETCDAILCISETTKRDLVRLYGDQDKPVLVTYLGVDKQFFRPGPVHSTPGKPYVLFVGSRKGYKNFQLLAQAFSRVSADLPNLHLMCVGGGRFTPGEKSVLADLSILNRSHQASPSDAELPAFYSQASVFCYPSRYEGFGLPLVEAFASGCPAVVADTPCLVEIADAAADIVSPDNADELAEAIARIVRDSTHRDILVAAGRQRASSFTWEATARNTVSAYEQVLQQTA